MASREILGTNAQAHDNSHFGTGELYHGIINSTYVCSHKCTLIAGLYQIFDALGFEWTNKPHNEKIKTRSVPVLKSKNELIKQDHDEQQQQEEVEEAMNAPDLLDESREANLTTSSSRPLNPGLSDQLDDVLGTILLGIKGYRGDRRFDFPIRSYVKDNDYNKH